MKHLSRAVQYGLLSGITALLMVVISIQNAASTPSIQYNEIIKGNSYSYQNGLIYAKSTVEANSRLPLHNPLDQGRQLYEAGQFQEAATILEQVLQTYQAQGDELNQAIALSNLAQVYAELGQWTDANEAIATGLSLLQSIDAPQSVVAQVMETKGRLQLVQGQTEQALDTWEQASELYQQLNDLTRHIRIGINQAEALQTLGLYRRAIALLIDLTHTIEAQPDSANQVIALRSLGDALRVSGELDQAEIVLRQSLEMAQRLNQSDEVARTQFSLGNMAYAQGDFSASADYYRQVIMTSSSPLTQVQAQLNQLKVIVETQAETVSEAEILAIVDQLDRLPSNRDSIDARINFAKSLISLGTQSDQSDHLLLAAQQLAIARQQAQQLGDVRAESFALGNLGQIYERSHQWSEAQSLTEQALQLAQPTTAPDIAYRWQWQLGRIHAAQDNRDGAIASYSGAIATLQSLRNDLVAVSPDVQFSFQESVEPVHRELVSLLLKPGIDPTQAELEQARKTIESLQLAELDNFFREACLNATAVQIDEVDRQAAVIYPIILGDRLEVILSVSAEAASPNSSRLLRRHTTVLPGGANELEQTASNLLQFLRQASANARALPLAQDLYGWLIAPFESELETYGVKTLVFVLDGALRNIPMAVLHDGERYLLEKYSIALTPGLQLLESQPLASQRLNVLLGGISEPRQQFSALPGVVAEFQEIEETVPSSRKLLNQEFTSPALQEAINAVPFPVVHLATHGQFSSTFENTFILTWDGEVTVNDLNQLLRSSDVNRRRPIELLVLSACETAEGDNRAALGLAGVAVRAGARSTVATLWQLNDEVAPVFMQRFYQELSNEQVTKAEAVRRAQLSLLENPRYSRPYYWSPITLIGNWQ
ncbi:MAG: CHAT domain-containing protein [Elainellaceae cyanobacterium]